MTRPEPKKLLDAVKAELRDIHDQTADYRAEFDAADDDALQAQLERLAEQIEEAEYKAIAIEAELWQRELRRVLA